MTNQILCRYFMQGACDLGKSCLFSHDRSAAPSLICKFYVQGNCSYGDKCRLDHRRPQKSTSAAATLAVSVHKYNAATTAPAVAEIKAETKGNNSGGGLSIRQNDVAYSEIAGWNATKSDHQVIYSAESECASKPLCEFSIRGFCKYGSNCKNIHGLQCPKCRLYCLHPYKSDETVYHLQQCTVENDIDGMDETSAPASPQGSGSDSAAKIDEACTSKSLQDFECSICFENVLTKDIPSHRQFGILRNCWHIFCLSCIREWRRTNIKNEDIVRCCPICRVESFYILPTPIFPIDEAAKEALESSYKGKLSTVDCKYFKHGEGQCPFSNKCFYKHAYSDGTLADRTVRIVGDAHGQGHFVGTSKLWDFLEQRL